MTGRARLPTRPAPPGTAEHLAVAALRYAIALDSPDATSLAGRLYRYHSAPISPDARRRWPSRAAVADFLGAADHDAAATRYVPDEHWHRWRPASRSRQPRSALHFKLYVSPKVSHLPETLRAVLDELPSSGAFECKVGGDVYGLHRPDRLVVYFRALEDLEGAAGRLTKALHRIPAHGVPFTAALGTGPLLSWGVDPPRRIRGTKNDSWRGWITKRVAASLIAARGRDPLARAVADLERLGVDTRTWTPPLAAWSKA